MADALDAVDWGRVTRRLTRFAHARLGRRGPLQEAEDLAREAIRQLLDPNYKDWNPENQPDVLQHLGSIVNGLISNRSRTRHEELLIDPVASEVGEPVGGGQVAERKVLASEVLDRLTSRIGSDRLVTGVFMLELDGVSEPSEQAVRLKVPVGRIYNARRRLQGHYAAVRTELEEEERHVVQE